MRGKTNLVALFCMLNSSLYDIGDIRPLLEQKCWSSKKKVTFHERQENKYFFGPVKVHCLVCILNSIQKAPVLNP